MVSLAGEESDIKIGIVIEGDKVGKQKIERPHDIKVSHASIRKLL